MRPNRRALVALGVSAAAVVMAAPVLFVLFVFFGPRLETDLERNSHRVAEGMAVGEVSDILGFRGSVQKNVPGLWRGDGKTEPFVHGDVIYLWACEGEQVWVGFQDGLVVSKYYRDLNYF